MKRLILISLLVIISSLLFAEHVIIMENSQKNLFQANSETLAKTIVQFSLDGYTLEKKSKSGQNYVRISHKCSGDFLQVGKPDLPRFTRLIAIPNDGGVSVNINFIEEETLYNTKVYPRQPLKKDSEKNIFDFTIDNDFYNSRSIFPQNIVELGEPAILRDYRIVSVTINPFQYNSANNSVRIIKNIELTIDNNREESVNEKTIDHKKSRFFEPLYRSMIQNYDSITSDRDEEFNQPHYLFIFPENDQVLSNLQILADWKHQKGFDVTLVSTLVAGATATNIKNYIQGIYNGANPPDFVCLVGDAGGSFNIPTFNESWSGVSGEGDHPYSQLEGSDILADVFIGRLSFETIAELQVIISKIFNYEKTPYTDNTDWFTEALLVGDPAHSESSTIITSKAIKEMIQNHSAEFSFDEVYSGFVAGMNTSFNDGVSYMNYRGFLGMSGWDNTNTANLNNYKMLPFVVILTCGTGNFQGTSDTRSECFLRAGTASTPKGAIAAIGTATSSTHTTFNNCVSAGTYYGIFNDGIYNPGGALTRGKLHLYNSFPDNPQNHVDIFSYWDNLMGDPGLELWTGVPQDLVVTHSAIVGLGSNIIEITVENSENQPIENAWVTILKGNDEIFATGFTDVFGNILLPLASGVSGQIDITVTNHNYIPYLGNFEINQLNRVLSVLETNVDDDNSGTSSGNGNSNVNPGENIEFGINLQNTGSRSANGVTAILSTTSEFVTITDNTESYGTIYAGVSTYSSDDFDFTIDNDVLGGTEIVFSLDISDSIGNSWEDFIYVIVQGPNLNVNSHFVVGGNNILDPDETADVTVTIENIGSVAASAVYGTLSCSNGLLAINDDSGYFGTVSASGQATNSTNRFTITADVLIAPGSIYEMELHLYNASGYDDIVFFDLIVGEALIIDPYGPDAYGYYCYDDEDVNYPNVPTYSWVEIDPNYGGSGTVIPMTDIGNTGDIEDINLPFNFKFYGENYSMITVCSNGWIAPGGTEQYAFMNWPIPGPDGPSPMIAPFWDDIETSSGHVCYYYDSTQHYFVVEWSRVKDEYDGVSEETFEIILYDPNYYSTETGDGDILFQYKVVNNIDQGDYGSYHVQHGQFATVGIEDHTSNIGLQYTFDNDYPVPNKILQNEMAILFTTNSPAPHTEPFVTLGAVTINDTGGNGNADYGETVNLDVNLNNMGLADATGVSAVLSSVNSYVTITQNSSNYSDILGGSAETNITDFTFDVDSNCPDGTYTTFELNVTSNEDSWTLFFQILLNAPVLQIQEAIVDDGDNNILDPNETAEILVTILNSGGAAVSNIQTVLSSIDTYLTINDDTDNLLYLASGANSNINFNVTSSASTPIGHMFICTVDFSADLGYITAEGFVLASAIFKDNFESDTGWTLSGEFQRGNPGGLGGSSHGNHDPSSAFSGTKVLGTDLTGLGSTNGDYEATIGDRAYQAISPAFDCTNYSNVSLEFQRWLNVERNLYDHAYIDVYNGSSWNNVWQNSSITIEENSWTLQTIDISAYADGNNNVKIRFCLGSTDTGWEYSGWNIDDIVISGDSKPIISVNPNSFDHSVSIDGSSNDNLIIANLGGSILDYTARVAYLDEFVTSATPQNKFENIGIRRESGEEIYVPFIKEVSEADNRDCSYSIDLYDTYGDGWNGGSVDLLINGSVVLSNLTLASGSGPESHSFTINTGDMISTSYTAGNWAYENEYYIYDNDGTQVASDGVGGVEPSNLSEFAATCTNDPTFAWLTLNGENLISGSIDIGSPEDIINVIFDSVPDNLIEGTHNANIVVTSNDPSNSEVVISVELTVQAFLNAPENTAIIRSGSNMIISWTAVQGASSYKIYSDTNPYGSFNTLEVSGWGSTNWTTSISGAKKYFRVVASTDASSRNRN
ncbi:MAG: hypothetical protein K8S23_17165 [Candidatus Cloacimonetes bacterium]|nr:hypothetical protein [Candidatus Cloacimonadota bacterium]